MVWALSCLLIVACSVADPAERPIAGSAQVLLEQLATAERSGDESAVRALIDPRATALVTRTESERTANLTRVPLSVWRYQLDGAAEVTGVYPALLEYAIAGGDIAVARRPLQISLVHRGAGWFLAGIDDRTGTRTYRAPWDFGRVEVRTAGPTAVVLVHPGFERLGADVVARLPAGIDDVAAAVGGSWSRDVVVWLTADDEEFTSLAGSSGTAATSVSDTAGSGSAAGQRIIFAPEAQRRLDRTELDVVIRHELVHVATRARTKGDTPRWVTEGFADFIAYQGPGRVEPQSGGLPADQDFAGPDANRAYAGARSVFGFIDDACGHSGVRFYDALAAGDPLGQVTARICGLDALEFAQSWRAWTISHAS